MGTWFIPLPSSVPVAFTLIPLSVPVALMSVSALAFPTLSKHGIWVPIVLVSFLFRFHFWAPENKKWVGVCTVFAVKPYFRIWILDFWVPTQQYFGHPKTILEQEHVSL